MDIYISWIDNQIMAKTGRNDDEVCPSSRVFYFYTEPKQMYFNIKL